TFFIRCSIIFSQQPVWREEILQRISNILGTKRALAIFADYNRFEVSDWVVAAIHSIVAVEFIVTAILVGGLLIASSIIMKTAVFHPNMMRITVFFLIHLYILLFSRIIIYLFQIRAIDVSEDVDFSTILIITATVIRFYISFALVFILVAVVAERVFATLLVHDYEKKDRYCIAIAELSCVFILSLTFALNFETGIFNFLPWQCGYVIIFAFTISGGITAIFLNYYNRKRLFYNNLNPM
ncbi:hypothetical protein PENTCL1PPCAC_27398, partial [Pristionchus entomophagus]